MNNEYLEIFVDKLSIDLPFMTEYVNMLQEDNNKETISILFRMFHNYKASSSFLKLKNFHQLVAQGEDILAALRNSKTLANDHDIQWLQACIEHFQLWLDQLKNEETLNEIDSSAFPTMAVMHTQEKTIDIMQNLCILYADTKKEQRDKMQRPFSAIFKSVICTDDIRIIKEELNNKTADLFLINMQEKSLQIAQELIQIQEDLPLITAITDLKPHQKSRLLLQGMNHVISSPIKVSELKRHLHDISNAYFSKRYSLISHKKIYNFIHGLDPLPSSTKRISILCDDEEGSIKDIIKVIESDSIATANILRAASMPIYGLTQTSSVEQAVVKFGKRLIKALTLSDMACTLGSLNLQAYNLSETQFKASSGLRLALMNDWYAKVNLTDISLLCSCAILGNLGQILINEELIKSTLDTEFQGYDKTNLTQAEVALLKTSSAFVTSDILEYWGLEAKLIDAIRYSDSPFNSFNPKIKDLACANAVVYTMVTPYGEILEEIPAQLKALMLKAGLDISLLEESLEKIRNT
ncbi:HDOD domain-containing protein [Sulfurimonas sp. MAG313]|nr:HDOD domain-containing protein [Sulfurimonas sp. MAG313]MDF1881814.1 HDOD domain-containing protein [Sulfurimonas sp. MAG313]